MLKPKKAKIRLPNSDRIVAAFRPRNQARLIDLPEGIARDRAVAFNRRMNHEFTARQANDDAVITIYDEIGYWGITASDVRRELDAITASNITVRLNSPGGDVFDGIAIYNDLLGHDANVNIEITGLAASAASIIAMAGDTVRIAQSAFIMVHNAWGVVFGNKHDMNEFADVLARIDESLAKVYAARTDDLDLSEIVAMMDAETWLSAEDAIADGFADELLNGDDDAPQAIFDLSVYAKTPAKVKRQVENSLRDAGYSTREAKRAAADGFSTLPKRDVSEPSGRRDADDVSNAFTKLRDDMREMLTRK